MTTPKILEERKGLDLEDVFTRAGSKCQSVKSTSSKSQHESLSSKLMPPKLKILLLLLRTTAPLFKAAYLVTLCGILKSTASVPYLAMKSTIPSNLT